VRIRDPNYRMKADDHNNRMKADARTDDHNYKMRARETIITG
jgi:hypothetical protein